MIRIPKIKRKHVSSFTTVNNVYLRDTTLGITERGLLTTMLSLPDNWEFSGRGLAAILPDGRDKVFASLRRLEEHGYLQRNKITLKGKVVDYEYEFCDCPIFPKRELSRQKTKKQQKNIPSTENHPCPENPDTVKTDGNKYTKQSAAVLTSLPLSEEKICDTGTADKQSSKAPPSLLPSSQDTYATETAYGVKYIPPPTASEIANIKDEGDIRRLIKSRIVMYDYCINRLSLSENDINYVVDVLVELLMAEKKQWIGGRYVGVRYIREKVRLLDAEKIAYIINSISRSAKGIKNYKKYLKAAIINFSDENV